MKLSPTQKKMLEHRPADCIQECLLDYEEGDQAKYTSDEVDTAIDNIEAMVASGEISGEIDGRPLTECEKDVLHDLIDGSTWFANSADPDIWKPSTLRRHIKEAEKLEDAVSFIIGYRVDWPLS